MTSKGRLLARATVPGVAPSVNHTYRASGGGRVYKTSEAKDWQTMAAVILASGRRPDKGWPHRGRVHLDLIFHVRNKRRSDMDNRIKAVQDCLAMAGIIEDDYQVWVLSAQRVRDGTESVEIEVWELDSPDEALAAKETG